MRNGKPSGQADDDFEELDEALAGAGIDVSAFGFYDQEEFLELEKAAPRALELYARWVLGRPRDAEYDAHVRATVPRLARLVERRLGTEGCVGACLNVATMMARMLDRLKVWSFAVQGSLTVELPSRPAVGRRYFPECDLLDHEDNIVGHGWLVAPPFIVVDSTLKHQRWVDLHPAIAACLPDVVAAEKGNVVRPRWFDVVSDALIEKYNVPRAALTPQLPYQFKHDLAHIEKLLPGRDIRQGELSLRYIPGAVKISEVPLDALPCLSPQTPGLVPRRIWEDFVRPEFGIIDAQDTI
jgi:hypothetical protein